jgi:hypothetical protein
MAEGDGIEGAWVDGDVSGHARVNIEFSCRGGRRSDRFGLEKACGLMLLATHLPECECFVK